jgi:exopolyphosphatase/guanosine-5'-triphosphate,3'-diphosphate pyrophosphatase
MQTSAVVDVGSNTVRLLVARCAPHALEELHTERVRLGLGREIERRGRLSRTSLAEAAEAVRVLCARARSLRTGSLQVLVTAPGRQAANGLELVKALERAAATCVRVLAPEEEARLAFIGARVPTLRRSGLLAVVDVGGASTEVAVGRHETEPAWLSSFDVGALRLATGMLATARPTRADVEAARAAVARAFAGVAAPLPAAALAVGGSARALGRVFGGTLRPGELSAAASLLPLCSPDEISRRFGVGKRRARLLLPAALILAEVQRRLAVPLLVADGGIREGALLAAEREAAAA